MKLKPIDQKAPGMARTNSEAIARRIALARKNAGMTQDKLASLIGVTGGAIAQYEIARHMPSYAKLEAIATMTGVTAGWLLTGDEPDEAVKAQTINESRLLALMRKIPESNQQMLLSMVAAMANTPKTPPNSEN